MVDQEHTNVALSYIGPPGATLGWQLAGIEVQEASSGSEVVAAVKRLAAEQSAHIIFVNESLATEVLDELDELNQNTLPAIVLLPDATGAQRVAAEKMNRLMVRAVGSDIFSNQ